MIDRRVQIIGEKTPPTVGEATLSAFAHAPNLILLGDPGSGKTHAFRVSAAAEGAVYLTARSFLNIPAEHLPPVLFIDGLDEQRAGPADNATVDLIVQKLFVAKPSKVRISCRSQDWLGDTDLAAFNDYFDRHGGVRVLALREIDEAEQIAILTGEGVSEEEARAFLVEAGSRNLDRFTRNPRKMVMLHRVVRSGAWPKTLKDLFDRATQMLLTEQGNANANDSARHFTADDLRGVAGGACTARLIADIEGLSLLPSSSGDDAPSYRSLTHLDPERCLAALKRPLFISSGVNTVDYDHRTSAEFLAAEWIASAVRGGLPLGRVQALIGVDGRPAAELRGLHAWLPIFLPEQAEVFIHADPLGVLEYGDPASLSAGARRALLKGIAALASENPWFLAFQRHPAGLAALVQDDSVAELCAMARDSNAPRDLRTVALEALEAAPPRQQAFETLRSVFVDGARHWHDRSTALRALVAFGMSGVQTVVAALPNLAGKVEDQLRLRGEAIEYCYGQGVGAQDVVSLTMDLLAANLHSTIGLLWDLADAVPIADLPGIIDDLVTAIPGRTEEGHRRSAWDAASFINRMVERVATQAPTALNGRRVLDWMDLRQRLKRLGGDERDQEFVKAIRDITGLPEWAFHQFVDEYAPDQANPGRPSRRYWQNVGPLVSADEACVWCLNRLKHEKDAERRAFLFDLSIAYARSSETLQGQIYFEEIYALGNTDDTLRPLLERELSCDLGWWIENQKHRESVAERNAERLKDKEKTRADFASKRELIRAGKHLGFLGFAAEIYFDWFGDLEHAAAPFDRLAGYFNADDAAAAIEGFHAVAANHPPPDEDTLFASYAEQKFFPWWWTMAASLDARLRAGGSLAGLKANLVTAVITMDLFQHVSKRVQRGDKESASLEETLRTLYPELAAPVYVRAIRSGLAKGEEHPDGLYALLDEAVFAEARRQQLLALLDDFPKADARPIEKLLQAALADADLHEGLRSRAAAALKNSDLGPRRLALWRATAFALQPEAMEAIVAEALTADRNEIWPLRDFLGYRRHNDAHAKELSPRTLQFLIGELGSRWPPANHPSNGWSGSDNPWDAAEFVRALINRLSAQTTADATDALTALLSDVRVKRYHDQIKYALAQQRVARREAEYDRPDWARVSATLSNRTPANAADLHALVLEHISDLAKQIDGDSGDIYRQFWNEKGHGVLDSPKPEESCRDALVLLLRPRLAPFGLTVEPEGHMSANKRVDIAIARVGLKHVVEIKLAHSPDVWTALKSQLDHLYTRDPETKGFGALLVLWFGKSTAKGATPNPASGQRPVSAQQFEQELRATVSQENTRLAAIVVDASGER